MSHKEYNPGGHETVLLLHADPAGLTSRHGTWDRLWPHLVNQGFHLLMVDLPEYGAVLGKDSLANADIDRAAHEITLLLDAKCPGGSVHVITSSIGTAIGATMASQYPERVRSLLISGFNIFDLAQISDRFGSQPYIVNRKRDFINDLVAKWRNQLVGTRTVEASCEISNLVLGTRALQPTSVRTMVIAATHEAICADLVDHTRVFYQTVLLNEGSQLPIDQEPLHPWDMCQPAAFVAMYQRWMEAKPLPDILAAIS